jgi:hypothetical protein
MICGCFYVRGRERVADQKRAAIEPPQMNRLFTAAPKRSTTKKRLVAAIPMMLDENDPRE